MKFASRLAARSRVPKDALSVTASTLVRHEHTGDFVDELTITVPDDWHLHVRDGDVLTDVVPFSAEVFARAIIMPNLKPPMTDTDAALAYRRRIRSVLPPENPFEPLMTLYLTDNTPPEEIQRARDSGYVHAVKLYPAGATTNSDSGVTDLSLCRDTLAAMAEAGMPLLIHGEVTDAGVDIFDREGRFLERTLAPLLRDFPKLRVVLEHVTTRRAVEFVQSGPENLAATITAHHLLLNRNDLLVGGIRPHYYCLPVLKREDDRQALVAAATSGNPKFFLGTDSAPHARGDKETACGCAGVFTAPAALALYAEAFDAVGRLERLEGFASHFGADFYGLPRNTGRITLTRETHTLPETYRFGTGDIAPMRGGMPLYWRVRGRSA